MSKVESYLGYGSSQGEGHVMALSPKHPEGPEHFSAWTTLLSHGRSFKQLFLVPADKLLKEESAHQAFQIFLDPVKENLLSSALKFSSTVSCSASVPSQPKKAS